MKKEVKLLISGFLMIFSIFIILIVVGLNKTKNQTEYYKSIKLNLNGTITNIYQLNYGHDYGLISIDVKKSNINNYDERLKLKEHLGVIKNKKAVLVFNSISSVKIGDSIVINIDKYKIYRNHKMVEENHIGIPNSNFIFTPFKEINQNINIK